MNVLIVGSGIAGLTLANLLEQQNIDVTICEKSEICEEHCYTIGIWPFGSRVLKGIDLYEKFEHISIPIYRFRIKSESNTTFGSFNMRSILKGHDPLRMVKKCDLLKMLVHNLKTTKILRPMQVVSMRQTVKKVNVKFSNSTEDAYDLVVGCDGIQSQVREMTFEETKFNYTNWSGWGWGVNKDYDITDTITEYWAKGKFIAYFPSKEGTFFFACLPDKDIPADPSEHNAEFFRKHFTQLNPMLDQMLGEFELAQNITHYKLLDINQRRWHKGRVALLGDSCVSILPISNKGASTAMESASILADELSRVGSFDVEYALNLYYKRHHKRLKSIQDDARKSSGWMFISGKFKSMNRHLRHALNSGRYFFKNIIELINNSI